MYFRNIQAGLFWAENQFAQNGATVNNAPELPTTQMRRDGRTNAFILHNKYSILNLPVPQPI